MWANPQFFANLDTFTEEILNGKLHFLCNENMALKQKNMAQKLFPNECKAIIQLVDVKAKIKTSVPGNSP